MCIFRYTDVFSAHTQSMMRSRILIPSGVAARPPSPVSRRHAGIEIPTSRIASITSSGGILLRTPASAMSAAERATTAPDTFRFTQGTSTNPATDRIPDPADFSVPSLQRAPLPLQSRPANVPPLLLPLLMPSRFPPDNRPARPQ